MIINDLDGYYIVFDTKNRNTELDTLINKFQNSAAKLRRKKRNLQILGRFGVLILFNIWLKYS